MTSKQWDLQQDAPWPVHIAHTVAPGRCKRPMRLYRVAGWWSGLTVKPVEAGTLAGRSGDVPCKAGATATRGPLHILVPRSSSRRAPEHQVKQLPVAAQPTSLSLSTQHTHPRKTHVPQLPVRPIFTPRDPNPHPLRT